MAKMQLNFCPFKHLPERGTPGHLFFVKESPNGPALYLAAQNGTLCPVTDLFNLQINEAPGRDGRDGVDGAPGRDGRDGDKGDKGDPGDITVVGDAELQAAAEKLRAQKASFIAVIQEKLSAMGGHGVYAVARKHLESILAEVKK